MTGNIRKSKEQIVTTVILDKDLYTKFKIILTCQDNNIKHAITSLLTQFVHDNSHVLDGINSQSNKNN